MMEMTTETTAMTHDELVETLFRKPRRERAARNEHIVELAHLTSVEYRARVLLDACHRTLAAIPEGEQTDADRAWATSMYRSWVDAWEDLDAFRRDLKAGA